MKLQSTLWGSGVAVLSNCKGQYNVSIVLVVVRCYICVPRRPCIFNYSEEYV